MTNTITLLQAIARPDAWFIGSLFHWGVFNLAATLLVVVMVVMALITTRIKSSTDWMLSSWAVVVALICFRLNHQIHSIGTGMLSSRLFVSSCILRLLLDAIILPSVATGLFLIKWKRDFIALIGRRRHHVLLAIICAFAAGTYLLVRLSDWLTGSMGLI